MRAWPRPFSWGRVSFSTVVTVRFIACQAVGPLTTYLADLHTSTEAISLRAPERSRGGRGQRTMTMPIPFLRAGLAKNATRLPPRAFASIRRGLVLPGNAACRDLTEDRWRNRQRGEKPVRRADADRRGDLPGAQGKRAGLSDLNRSLLEGKCVAGNGWEIKAYSLRYHFPEGGELFSAIGRV
jgi:hypothetical protein